MGGLLSDAVVLDGGGDQHRSGNRRRFDLLPLLASQHASMVLGRNFQPASRLLQQLEREIFRRI